MKTLSKVSHPLLFALSLALAAPSASVAAAAATTGDPPIPIDQIIEQFVAKETEFAKARRTTPTTRP